MLLPWICLLFGIGSGAPCPSHTTLTTSTTPVLPLSTTATTPVLPLCIDGETACEGQGFNASQCEAVGCCEFDDGECWSSVGAQICLQPCTDNLPNVSVPPKWACSDLPDNIRQAVQQKGFLKLWCPFNILVAGTLDYEDAWLDMASGIVDELVDQDGDGECDNQAVCDQLSFSKGSSFTWLYGGLSDWDEMQGDDLHGLSIPGTGSDPSYDYNLGFSLQVRPWMSTLQARAVLTEECFHTVHQAGWAEVFPGQLGNFDRDDASSVLVEQCLDLQCVQYGWWHPENDCEDVGGPRAPGDPAESPLIGTCSSEDCDCVEFFQQAQLLYVGQAPAWCSEYMPGSQNDTESMLSDNMRSMLENPALPTLKRPLRYDREVGEHPKPTFDDPNDLCPAVVQGLLLLDQAELLSPRMSAYKELFPHGEHHTNTENITGRLPSSTTAPTFSTTATSRRRSTSRRRLDLK